MGMLKRFFQVGTASILLFLAAVPIVSAAGPGLEMSVRAGFDGVVRVNSQAPFVISVTNSGGNEFKGEAEVVGSNANNTNIKTIYAVPVSLAPGAKKDITINVPVFSLAKKIPVRLEKDGKVVLEKKYDFTKLINPVTRVIGILSDDPDSLRVLNGIKLTNSIDVKTEMDMKMKYASGMYQGGTVQIADVNMPEVSAETINLDKNSLPDEAGVFDTFDIIVIDNFDTSSLTKKQISALENWVTGGKTLIVCTGPNQKKAYSGLPDSLKQFNFTKADQADVPASIGTFTGKPAPSGKLLIAKGDIGKGKALIGEKNSVLLASYKVGNGHLGIMAFDPSIEPVASWDGAGDMWKKAISGLQNEDSANANNVFGSGISIPAQFSMANQGLVYNVPENQTPPFMLLLIMIGVYIVIVGPFIYILLKIKDKRDYGWVIIPAAAFLFLGIIYVAGVKTRYTTAVLNNASVINLDSENKQADISTSMGVFNNERGNMTVVYEKDSGISSTPAYIDDGMSYRGGPVDPNAERVVGKLTMSDNIKNEIYDIPIWQPSHLEGKKRIPLDGRVIDSLSLEGGVLKAVIKNPTNFALRDSFVVLGNNFIHIGDIRPGEKKDINVSLSDKSVRKRYQDYMDRYGPPYINPGMKIPDNWKENSRKRTIIESSFGNIYQSISGKGHLLFFALNYDDPGYKVTVNGNKPKVYNSNAIYSVSGIDFSKGSRIELPSGILVPALQNPGKTANIQMEDPVSGGVSVFANGDVDFTLKIPDNISVDGFTVKWSKFLPMGYRYNSPNVKFRKDKYKFYIYNTLTKSWEETKEIIDISSNPGKYLDQKNQIQVRANVEIDQSGPEGEQLGLPEFSVNGGVK